MDKYFDILFVIYFLTGMAEENEIRQLDRDNRNESISSQLNNILKELGTLKQEVHGTHANVASEVKKLKNEKDLVWRFVGNKIQYDFNGDCADIVKQSIWAIENGKLDYCREQLEELSEKLHKRNKLIRIADSSSGGWETVRQYEANPVASDSDDESKIYKAEGRALKRKRSSSRGKTSRVRDYGFSTGTGIRSWGFQSTGPVQQFSFQPAGRGRLFRPQYSTPAFGATNGNGLIMPGSAVTPGSCYACGEFTHFRRNCPYVRPATVTTGEQQSGQQTVRK